MVEQGSMGIDTTNGFIIIKTKAVVDDKKPFEVVQSQTTWYEVVASGEDDVKVGDTILVADIHYMFIDEGVEYRVVRATDVIGIRNV